MLPMEHCIRREIEFHVHFHMDLLYVQQEHPPYSKKMFAIMFYTEK